MSVIESLDKNMPILIVDDYPTMRKIVKNCLTQLGFKNIEEAENGQSALEKLKSNEFKFVIADWHMPNMMGLDLLKAIRADDSLKELPFLIITPETRKEKNIEEAVQAGASQFIVKPLTKSALQNKMEAMFNRKG